MMTSEKALDQRHADRVRGAVAFDPTKPFTTRDGRDVMHLHRITRGQWTWDGLVDGMRHTWKEDGSWGGRSNGLDLVNAPAVPPASPDAIAVVERMREEWEHSYSSLATYRYYHRHYVDAANKILAALRTLPAQSNTKSGAL